MAERLPLAKVLLLSAWTVRDQSELKRGEPDCRVVAGMSESNSGSGLTLAVKVKAIKASLELSPSLSVQEVLDAANHQLCMSSDGSMLSQVNSLFSTLGLGLGLPPPTPPRATQQNNYETPDPNQPVLYDTANAARVSQHVYAALDPSNPVYVEPDPAPSKHALQHTSSAHIFEPVGTFPQSAGTHTKPLASTRHRPSRACAAHAWLWA